MIVFNKIDTVKNPELIDSYLKRFRGSVAISARTGAGVGNLVKELQAALGAWRLRSLRPIFLRQSRAPSECRPRWVALEAPHPGTSVSNGERVDRVQTLAAA